MVEMGRDMAPPFEAEAFTAHHAAGARVRAARLVLEAGELVRLGAPSEITLLRLVKQS